MPDRLNHTTQDTGHLRRTTQYVLDPNDRVISSRENDDAGVVDLDVQTAPEYSAESYAPQIATIKQDLFLVTAALEKSDFRDPSAPTMTQASPSQAPRAGTGGRRGKKNKLAAPAPTNAPSVTPKQQKAIDKRVPRTKKEHLLLAQHRNKLLMQLVTFERSQKAAKPSGQIRTVYVVGEPAYGLNHTVDPTLGPEERIAAWYRYGHQNVPPNRYKGLNKEWLEVRDGPQPKPAKKAKKKKELDVQPTPEPEKRRRAMIPGKRGLFYVLAMDN